MLETARSGLTLAPKFSIRLLKTAMTDIWRLEKDLHKPTVCVMLSHRVRFILRHRHLYLSTPFTSIGEFSSQLSVYNCFEDVFLADPRTTFLYQPDVWCRCREQNYNSVQFHE